MNSETAFWIALACVFVVACLFGMLAPPSWNRLYALFGVGALAVIVGLVVLTLTSRTGEGSDHYLEIGGHWVPEWPAAALWWALVPWIAGLTVGSAARLAAIDSDERSNPTRSDT
jgi:uncharacterized protein YjeT (DUF2065 family)